MSMPPSGVVTGGGPDGWAVLAVGVDEGRARASSDERRATTADTSAASRQPAPPPAGAAGRPVPPVAAVGVPPGGRRRQRRRPRASRPGGDGGCAGGHGRPTGRGQTRSAGAARSGATAETGSGRTGGPAGAAAGVAGGGGGPARRGRPDRSSSPWGRSVRCLGRVHRLMHTGCRRTGRESPRGVRVSRGRGREIPHARGRVSQATLQVGRVIDGQTGCPAPRRRTWTGGHAMRPGGPMDTEWMATGQLRRARPRACSSPATAWGSRSPGGSARPARSRRRASSTPWPTASTTASGAVRPSAQRRRILKRRRMASAWPAAAARLTQPLVRGQPGCAVRRPHAGDQALSLGVVVLVVVGSGGLP